MTVATPTGMPTSASATEHRAGLGQRVAPYAQEVLVIGIVFLLYRQVRFISQDDGSTALANADRLLRWEHTLFALSERTVQEFVLRSDAAIEFLNRYYVTVHFPLTVMFLLWLLFRHPDGYRRMRNWLIATTVIALGVHIIFPLAPPRMLPDFVDTLRVYGPNIYPADTSASMANQFAAMPSLHFGWSVIVAAGFMMTVRRRWSAVALLHPSVTLLAIVATGNHYFLDAAAAGVIVMVAAWMSTRLALPPLRSTRATRATSMRRIDEQTDAVLTMTAGHPAPATTDPVPGVDEREVPQLLAQRPARCSRRSSRATSTPSDSDADSWQADRTCRTRGTRRHGPEPTTGDRAPRLRSDVLHT